MSNTFRRTAWAITLASSLFLVGCDDDDDDVTRPSPVQSASPSPSPSPSASPSASPSPSNNANRVVSFVGVARQVDGASGTLRVGGRRVDVNEGTTIKNMNGQGLQLSDIRNGHVVRVRGREFDDGSVLAEVITLQGQ